MTTTTALLLFVCVLCLFFALRRAKPTHRRTPQGNLLMVEYRTDYAVDECIDRLRATAPDDLFIYTFVRETNGTFALHFTQHRATQQPIDTLYTLQLDAGRQTMLSLVFIREAFGYQEPVFPLALLDEFFAQKLAAHRVEIDKETP